jgi:hypothetical protein
MTHTDTLAEIQNTVRPSCPAVLADVDAHQTGGA